MWIKWEILGLLTLMAKYFGGLTIRGYTCPALQKILVQVGTAQYGLLEPTRAEQPTTLAFTDGPEVIGKASREVECKYLSIALVYLG